MLQQESYQWPMGISHAILAPHLFRGVAPSRHDVALAAYLEKQAAQRAAIVASQPSQKANQRLWSILLHAARRVAAIWQLQHGFEISHPRNAVK